MSALLAWWRVGLNDKIASDIYGSVIQYVAQYVSNFGVILISRPYLRTNLLFTQADQLTEEQIAGKLKSVSEFLLNPPKYSLWKINFDCEVKEENENNKEKISYYAKQTLQ